MDQLGRAPDVMLSYVAIVLQPAPYVLASFYDNPFVDQISC